MQDAPTREIAAIGSKTGRMPSNRLGEYHARGYLTWHQMRAGEMWCGDWMAGQPSTRHRSMERARGGGCGGGFDMGGIAAIRYQRAARFLGPGLYPIAKGVCIDDRPAREFTQSRDERDDAAMPILRLALDLLARFYRVDEPDVRGAVQKDGSVGAEWLEWPVDQMPAVVVAGKRKPPPSASVVCYKCSKSWPYGQDIEECGKAGCRAPGSMIIVWT